MLSLPTCRESVRWPTQVIERGFKRPSPHDAIVATCRQRGALASDDTETPNGTIALLLGNKGFESFPECRRVVPVRSNDLQMQTNADSCEGGGALDRREFTHDACSHCKKILAKQIHENANPECGERSTSNSRVSVGPEASGENSVPGGAPKLWAHFSLHSSDVVYGEENGLPSSIVLSSACHIATRTCAN